MRNWILGAYAGYASLPLKNEETERKFWRGLADLPSVRGLELPYYDDLHMASRADLSDAFVKTLPRDWDYFITPLPGTMNALQRNAGFGLASEDEEGRQAALVHAEGIRRRVVEIQNHCGRNAVLAVEFHSAPTRKAGQGSSAEALEQSLAELLTWDWAGAKIVMEHCDAWRDGQQGSKCFRDLFEEKAIAEKLGVGISLNWGRSVLEGRGTSVIAEQIAFLGPRLSSLFFSGVAVDDPVYGSWLDNHAPLRLHAAAPWEATGSLLTKETTLETLQLLKGRNLLGLGIKVQPAPPELSVDERLSFLAQQILGFDALLAQV